MSKREQRRRAIRDALTIRRHTRRTVPVGRMHREARDSLLRAKREALAIIFAADQANAHERLHRKLCELIGVPFYALDVGVGL